jgi:hypothetical protein
VPSLKETDMAASVRASCFLISRAAYFALNPLRASTKSCAYCRIGLRGLIDLAPFQWIDTANDSEPLVTASDLYHHVTQPNIRRIGMKSLMPRHDDRHLCELKRCWCDDKITILQCGIDQDGRGSKQ